MKLQLAQLNEGENSFHLESPKEAWLKELLVSLRSEETDFKVPATVDLSLTKLEPEFYLKGKLALQADRTCDRCAERFPARLEHAFELALTHSSRHAAVKDEIGDAETVVFEGSEIDLAPLLKEQMLLALPYRSLCRPDCKGICQKCGKNLNQGTCGCAQEKRTSPFSVLKELKK